MSVSLVFFHCGFGYDYAIVKISYFVQSHVTFQLNWLLVMKICSIWPRYASIEEDEVFRKNRWSEMTKDEKRFRIIIHDMSNFTLPEPSDGDLNKTLWSKDHGGPCGKGGDFHTVVWMGGYS